MKFYAFWNIIKKKEKEGDQKIQKIKKKRERGIKKYTYK
jgi:vacuolar-type H+-ATPase subunit H